MIAMVLTNSLTLTLSLTLRMTNTYDHHKTSDEILLPADDTLATTPRQKLKNCFTLNYNLAVGMCVFY